MVDAEVYVLDAVDGTIWSVEIRPKALANVILRSRCVSFTREDIEREMHLRLSRKPFTDKTMDGMHDFETEDMSAGAFSVWVPASFMWLSCPC